MKAVGTGVCILVTFAVAAFGGTTAWGRAILEIGTAALVLMWGWLALRRGKAEIHGNWLYVPLLGLIVLALAQLLFRLSVYPYSTKTELLLWGALLLLFFLAAESFRTVEDACAFAWFLVSLGFAVSLFGIAQHFTFNGKLYWLLSMEAGGGPFGPFVDRDHFAGFVELAVPPGLALLLFQACRRDKIVVLGMLSTLPIGALVLAGSRGGILTFSMEIILLLFLARGLHAKDRHLPEIALAVFAAGALTIWLGGAATWQRFAELKPSEVTRDQRVTMYEDTWKLFLHHPWIGTGLGTLAIVFPQNESRYNQPGVDHAHNDYLELLADTGMIGGLLGLGFVAVLFWRGVSNLRLATTPLERALYAGSLVSCCGLLLHSLVDFNLHIPANALLFVLSCAMVTTKRAGRLHRPPQHL